jgi:outer membrane lipoprotein-sorting protein
VSPVWGKELKEIGRIWFLVLAVICAAAAGCAVSQRRAAAPAELRPQLDASQAQLVAAYNTQARSVSSVNATVRMSPVAGSAYSGVIEQYHDVGGFILAARPSMIRVIGQAPVVAKDVFDMVSDGRVFRIFIPSKNAFLVGSTALERPSKKPIENLRPQHILDALFWPELPENEPVLFEEADAPPARYYVLTSLRRSGSGLEIARKIWFDRADLRISRIEIYGPGGRLDADIAYSHWQNDAGAGTATAASTAPAGSLPAGAWFPREIHITRPQEDYQLALSITKLTLNSEIADQRFTLAQPSGTDLVHVGENEPGAQP